MIVLTEAEYADLIEDAGDAALADVAVQEQGDAPAVPHTLLVMELEGRIGPLETWRRAAGYSQSQLAERAGLGVEVVEGIESGALDPRLSALRALAAALKVGVGDIVD